MLRGSVSAVGHLQDQLDRAREIYQAAIKREESNYFDRIKRIMAAYAADEAAASPLPNGEPSSEQPPPAAA
jgi:hypothetical protein